MLKSFVLLLLLCAVVVRVRKLDMFGRCVSHESDEAKRGKCILLGDQEFRQIRNSTMFQAFAHLVLKRPSNQPNPGFLNTLATFTRVGIQVSVPLLTYANLWWLLRCYEVVSTLTGAPRIVAIPEAPEDCRSMGSPASVGTVVELSSSGPPGRSFFGVASCVFEASAAFRCDMGMGIGHGRRECCDAPLSTRRYRRAYVCHEQFVGSTADARESSCCSTAPFGSTVLGAVLTFSLKQHDDEDSASVAP
ncbi:hypothetical protein HPB50_010031 [Hyalomma asiaticum]|uniref:Uncharacterized protein n=1 Tax=Hyalomma asiaticum TaxID=266040 RepID=A0ACB7SGB6_HYAAI|nr:hypothetical protein HPB50_010031 [Hyalomma asiaticum]